ncbi:hypothetical protein HP437_00610 (plasmid) [Serratia marcescens]|uniref:hypothetical protein n=1 Tax=Serratia marcescens TaxID=615 RepID=UPI0015D82650|nr:hypothetical protein [Serratia marcescens]QLJ63764.1 hypothetical protein HP437_00610 [Serratia marcescens]BEM46470.1 hypothetical protein SME13J_50890 [Serratia marcescens]
MNKQEYRLYLAILKARGDQARKAMAGNVLRREALKAHRHRRSEGIRTLLNWKALNESVDCLLVDAAELEAREQAFGK